MKMATREELEAKVLELPTADRAALARRLMESLDESGIGDYDAEWIAEAERRYAEYRRGLVETRPAEQVLREARARLG